MASGSVSYSASALAAEARVGKGVRLTLDKNLPVASGIGGERIVSECQRVLNEEYPELSRKLRVMLPDENFRRVGQSMAAASLPDIR